MKIKDITLKSSREIEVIESAINFLNKNLFDNSARLQHQKFNLWLGLFADLV